MSDYECTNCEALWKMEVVWDGGTGPGYCPFCGEATAEEATGA